MKKTIWLIFIVLTAGFLFCFLRTSTVTIIGKSMEPEFRQGDFIVFKQVLPQQVKEGDVIVFEVPIMIREQYNFPPMIAHRVIKITRKDDGITFNTKGDANVIQDPFTVRTMDLKGIVSHKISYLGNLFIFVHGKQGLIFITIFLVLFSLYIYKEELKKRSHNLVKRIFFQSMKTLEKSVKRLEEREEKINQAINRFASVMTEYAKHLESHTEAIQNLANASEELKETAKGQTKFLKELTEVLESFKEKRDG